MVVAELLRRSPIRVLERSIHGGLAPGEFGIVAGPRGVGKTACLVHLAIDRLLQQHKVVHVSFAANTTHISVWYEDIFQELARRYQLDGVAEAHDSIIPNRVLANFEAGDGCWSRVQRTISTLASSGGFRAHSVVVDGYRFPHGELESFRGFRTFAAEMGLEVWFSASVESPEMLSAGIPQVLKTFAEECAVVIVLVDRGTYIHLSVAKDRANPVADCRLKLDPHFLLIVEEDER